MLTPEEIRIELKDRNLAAVATKSNLSYGQVYGLASGSVRHPAYEVVKALSDYLEGKGGHGEKVG